MEAFFLHIAPNEGATAVVFAVRSTEGTVVWQQEFEPFKALDQAGRIEDAARCVLLAQRRSQQPELITQEIGYV